jgi:hypothetical protein
MLAFQRLSFCKNIAALAAQAGVATTATLAQNAPSTTGGGGG